MYGDGDGAVTGSKAGLVGRRGLMAFILDIIAASPPLLAPPDLSAVAVNGGGGGGGGRGGGGDNTPLSSASSLSPQEGGGQGRVHVVAAAAGAPTPPAVDLEMELEGVLAKMAGVVLAEVRKRKGETAGRTGQDRSPRCLYLPHRLARGLVDNVSPLDDSDWTRTRLQGREPRPVAVPYIRCCPPLFSFVGVLVCTRRRGEVARSSCG